jgi:hypothetical protein
MAKGVTEEELKAGLSGLGAFGGIGAGRPRRDSVFRDTRDEGTPTVLPTPVEPVRPAEIQPVKVEAAPLAAEVTAPVRESKPIPLVKEVPRVQKEPERKEPPKEKPPVMEPPAEEQVPAKGRKADVHTERVTLPISPEMRDGVDALARSLQRHRTKKGESITANAVIRTAVRLVLERANVAPGDIANSEDELFHLLAKKLRKP